MKSDPSPDDRDMETEQIERIELTKSDVTVEEITDECGECTVTIDGPAYSVMLDIRSAGMTTAIEDARFCKDCAEKIARRIRDGLPE
jgi:ribosomal protein L37AE/L43A